MCSTPTRTTCGGFRVSSVFQTAVWVRGAWGPGAEVRVVVPAGSFGTLLTPDMNFFAERGKTIFFPLFGEEMTENFDYIPGGS